MSFSVVAGGQDQGGNSNLSPFAAAFLSRSSGGNGSAPNSANAGTRSGGVGGGMPPPFSLSSAGGGGAPGTPGSSVAHLPDDALFQNQKRIGTDPSKFKTTICRNWEQTGICSFRGCTFAHGVDDLRPPMRVSTQSLQPLGTPTTGKKSPSTSPTLQASAAHNGGHTAPTRLDKLIEMLSLEVSKDKDLVLVHQEAYRTLEAMLRREHTLYDDAHNKLEGTKLKVGLFIKKLREKDASLQRALTVAKPSEVSADVRRNATSMTQSMESVIAQAQGETQAILADQEEALGAEGRRGPTVSSYTSHNEGGNWGEVGGARAAQDQQHQTVGYTKYNGTETTGQSSRTDSNAAESSSASAAKINPSGLSYAAAAGKRGAVKPPASIGLQPIDALCDDDEDYTY